MEEKADCGKYESHVKQGSMRYIIPLEKSRQALRPHKWLYNMKRQTSLFSAAIVLFTVALAVAADKPAARTKPIPSLSEVRQVVLRYFKAQPDFRSGDLITRNQVEPLLRQLQKLGLPLPDAKQILELTPASDEFLAQQLRTPNGRSFMRKISGYKDAYDRVDRLSRLPIGQQTVRDLIRGPGGEKMIEYMTTASGGKELGKMLSDAPLGKNFNDPTGRLYTVEKLMARLEQSRDASIKAAAKR